MIRRRRIEYIKEGRLRWLGHAARRSDNNMVKSFFLLRGYPDMCNLLDVLVALGYALYAMRDVKDMGQQMGYRSLEWNWPKEAMNRPI